MVDNALTDFQGSYVEYIAQTAQPATVGERPLWSKSSASPNDRRGRRADRPLFGVNGP